jgi:hypothetical protein
LICCIYVGQKAWYMIVIGRMVSYAKYRQYWMLNAEFTQEKN